MEDVRDEADPLAIKRCRQLRQEVIEWVDLRGGPALSSDEIFTGRPIVSALLEAQLGVVLRTFQITGDARDEVEVRALGGDRLT